MTDLDKLRQAQDYMDKLAEGLDPFSGVPLPQESILNDVRLAQCFFYVGGLLRQMTENRPSVKTQIEKKEKKAPFYIAAEDLSQVPITEPGIPITRLCDTINQLFQHDGMKKLCYKWIIQWLMERGYLEERESNGDRKRFPGPKAASIGIYQETRLGYRGEYQVILYGPKAQQFILDHLIGIVADAQI